jgi:hypothetical protein
MPTKLASDLIIPIDIPIAAICVILVIFNEIGDFYTAARFLMMMNHHPPERHLRLDFHAQSVNCRPGRWIAGTRGMTKRVDLFHLPMVEERWWKMDKGRGALLLPPT